jgi:hypothetical protein
MEMSKNWTLLVAITILSITVAGCNMGKVPQGMTQNDAKNAIEKMTPEQKIKFYASSPMPQAEKEKKYAEIEAKTGVKAKDVLSGGPQLPPTH